MSLLSMIGDVCEQIGLLRPAIVLSSLDQQVKQLLAIANREGRELATGDSVGMAYFWTALDIEATWLTTGVENQGNIATLMPGFRRIYPDTMWDRTLRQRILGITADEWQQLKAGIIQSPYFRYRFSRGIVSFLPAPAINHTIATEFATFNWVNRGTFINSANSWDGAGALDSDTSVLPEDIMQQGIVWRWKASKNLDYAEDYRSYQTIVLNAMANDGPKPTIYLDSAPEYSPGIAIPSGSWGVV